MSTTASWYHANVKSISRGKDKTYVGLVAYATGEKLQNPETGRQDKRNHPGDVVSWGIVAPEHAPSWFTDKKQIERLAQAVQASETRSNAQFGNHWDIALWRNGTPEQHEALARRISQRYVERYGTLVIYAIHAPSGQGSEHNWHLHLAPNMRRITELGFGEKATEITDGKTRHLETEWVRRMIAEETNAFLKSVNSDERVTQQSYKQRGILKQPMVHMGNDAWQAEKRGIRTDVGDWNRVIRAVNEDIERTESPVRHAAPQKAKQRKVPIQAEIKAEARARKDPMELTPEQSNRTTESVASGFEQAADKFDQARAAIFHGVYENSQEFMRENERMGQEAEKKRQELEDADYRKRRDLDIEDPVLRWKQASERPMDGDNPFRMLAAAARSEGAMFNERQESLRKEEAGLASTNPDLAEITKMKRHVEAAEFMAFTSERLIWIARINTGRKGSEGEEKYQDMAHTYREIAQLEREHLTELRDAYDDKQRGLLLDQATRLERQAREDPWAQRYARPDREEPKEEFFGVAQPLPENAPNRDRPQNDQREPINPGQWRDVVDGEIFDPGRVFQVDPNRGRQVYEPAQPHTEQREQPFDAAAWRQQDSAEYAARENLYDGMAARDAERRQAGEEMTDAKRQRPEPERRDAQNEITDADAERQAMLRDQLSSANERAGNSLGRSHGTGR